MDQQRLIFNGRDLNDQKKLSFYKGLEDGVTIYLVYRLKGGAPDGNTEEKLFVFDVNDIDPSFHYDFTNLKDDGKVYKRGTEIYLRPYGWNRLELQVSNKVYLNCLQHI